MFQTFDPVSDKSFASAHLPKLRARLADMGLDGFIVPHDDEYQNEYIPAYAERLLWATGFSGSAGAAVIMADAAALFVDGRYTLQVRQETDDAFFAYCDLVATPIDVWLADHAPKGARIGYDPLLHTGAGVAKLEAAAKRAGFKLVAVDDNPVAAAWADQPPRPTARIERHDAEFAGRASADKRREVAEAVEKAGADATLITAPPSIAWLFNVRGRDVSRTPLALGRALVHTDGTASLFVAPEKVGNDLAGWLGDDVAVRDEADVEDALRELGAAGARVAVDPSLSPAKYGVVLREAGATVVDLADPCALPRAVKNAAELEGARAAHQRDGVPLARFLHWIDETAANGDLDEIRAVEALEAFRRETGALRDISFDTISGSGPHGAIVHYRVNARTNRNLAVGELFLVDSGAQYQDGTTDVTRTVPIGTPTEEMRDRFTRVLKGHIAIATARFPEGTTGQQLDALARAPLWSKGLDYDHGTGHGVGAFLGVHEGPQGISKNARHAEPLRPGMIVSNEPGNYNAGEYGIRIENLLIVMPHEEVAGGDRAMMGFETLTLAPIDRRLIVPDLLSPAERDWLNAYHARVRETIGPAVPPETASWLDQATQPI
ncbi:MAG: M24 family metallopeptidase [Parvularculaceae bacterium]